MDIEEERIKRQKENKEKEKKKRKEWLEDRYRKWSTIILKWFGLLFVLLLIALIFQLGVDLVLFATWAGMFLNDLGYELGFLKPWDKEKLVVEFKEDREHI